ncbi:hypothetical protein, partial [Legionella sp.]|uniref:hypothetical protein n=1 Tax=Legionella sp. TaxID=459 RepID=UPI003C838867
MSRNADLLNKLNNLILGKRPQDITGLLDAILSVNPEDANAFRNAIKPYAKLLELMDSTSAEEKRVHKSNYYSSDEFLDPHGTPNFLEIQQIAAAQRVKFSLNKLTDQEVLLNILKNNEEICRSYLAEKVEPKLTDAYYWKKAEEITLNEKNLSNQQIKESRKPSARWVRIDAHRWKKVPSEVSILREKVLPDNQIEKIRKWAATSWVLQAIDNAPLEELNKLAEDNKPSFQQAIQKLGFSENVKFIDVPFVRDLIKDKVEARRTQLSALNTKTDKDSIATPHKNNKSSFELEKGVVNATLEDLLTRAENKIGPNNIQLLFMESDTPEEFIESYFETSGGALTNEEQKFKEDLESELTDTAFRKIRTKALIQGFEQFDKMKKIQAEEALQKSRQVSDRTLS